MAGTALVGVIMGSRSDWETLRHSAETLEKLGIAHETRVVSAHRTPERLFDYAKQAAGRGLKVIIANKSMPLVAERLKSWSTVWRVS